MPELDVVGIFFSHCDTCASLPACSDWRMGPDSAPARIVSRAAAGSSVTLRIPASSAARIDGVAAPVVHGAERFHAAIGVFAAARNRAAAIGGFEQFPELQSDQRRHIAGNDQIPFGCSVRATARLRFPPAVPRPGNSSGTTGSPRSRISRGSPTSETVPQTLRTSAATRSARAAGRRSRSALYRRPCGCCGRPPAPSPLCFLIRPGAQFIQDGIIDVSRTRQPEPAPRTF